MNDDFAVIKPNVRLWNEDIAPGAIGSMGTATTDRGNPFGAWRANDGVPETLSYFCHGHSTGSYERFKYTPCSGPDMAIIIRDEYQQITKKPQVGDIILFRARRAGDGLAPGDIAHSALVVQATHHFGGRTDIRVSTKNGADRLINSATLDEVRRTYNTCYWFKTEQTCCGMSEDRIDKQYYRRRG
jgi:hypothetical protein